MAPSATSSQVLDPAEETLPYEGRTEFLCPDGGERWVADRVEKLRTHTSERLEAHRAELDRADASASAGRSSCITPTARRPNRC